MVESAVKRLMDEIYGMKLIDGLKLVGVKVARQKMLGGELEPPGYNAWAEYDGVVNAMVSASGKSPEEALNVLKGRIIEQYAPDHVNEYQFLDLPVNLQGMAGQTIMELGRFRVEVPKSTGQTLACGCSVDVVMKVTDQGENGTVVCSPRYNWCETHIQAYAMRRLLEHERKVALEWMKDKSLSSYTILELEDRIADINLALGEKGEN